MMWNALVSALLLRSSIVMLDGDPAWPDLAEQWRLAERNRPTVMGVSPPYLMACRKAGLNLRDDFDLSSIRVLCTAGSPLPAEGYRWVYEQLGPDVCLVNGSGGTDVCTGIVSGCPGAPVYEGEISCACLGVDAKAFDEDGNQVVGELGELVITSPMPSMPVALWGDEDGERYRSSYFDRYPGVWRQGDWIKFTPRGSCVLTGRSDATLNRGGVRLGTGEFYSVVEEFPELADALVVHLEDNEGGMGELLLFVVPSPGRDGGRRAARAPAHGAAHRALTAPRARRHHRGQRDPPHPDRQEARGAGQAAAPRRARREGRQPRFAGRPGGAGRIRGARRRTRGPRSFKMTEQDRPTAIGTRRETGRDEMALAPAPPLESPAPQRSGQSLERWCPRGADPVARLRSWSEILAATHLAFEVKPTLPHAPVASRRP